MQLTLFIMGPKGYCACPDPPMEIHVLKNLGGGGGGGGSVLTHGISQTKTCNRSVHVTWARDIMVIVYLYGSMNLDYSIPPPQPIG